MFDYFKTKGLDNLIWVWTTQMSPSGSDESVDWYCKDDTQWYPGDEYVDIIAHDSYNQAKVSSGVGEFELLQSTWQNKMITLGENGSISNISDIFNAGGTFSYFMPWYTFDLTNLDDSQHANTSWWQDAANCDKVLFLEDMKGW